MKGITQKESYPRFLLKMAVTFGLICATGMALGSRFRIGVDSQREKCLPSYTFFLIDRADKSLARGHTYAFSARHLQPFFEDGTQMVKILAAMPGDVVEVTADQLVKVNGHEVGKGLPHAERLGRTVASFVGKAVLTPQTYWFMGNSPQSFDSRYWGGVNDEQIIGRAYPLF
ncbi:S26 family signal peptidase [Azomonas macrocytogenes]|uniref:Conjugal transfer pilin signal peptidase TrbI n=1 Tax=Azomonas macrocytogenes TaxID=69962 RepID=A0A839T7W5_AZOMA|nr:S26 family signal peptidase [Azomonas macrocytogenes]MBB3105178.1 conjugal transfer pilin signal peptidase TrbI [Azomonas macrocytogenes]